MGEYLSLRGTKRRGNLPHDFATYQIAAVAVVPSQ
jgi:hypothetical protein